MDRQALFNATVTELIDIVENRTFDEYAMLRASAIVRTLLLDDDPLLHQVNRQRRRRIRFVVRGEDRLSAEMLQDRPIFWARNSAFSPRLALRPGNQETLTRDQFLKRRVLQVNGEAVSVRELVLQLANVEGGVHPGVPRTDLQHMLAQTNSSIQVGGIGAVAATMHAVADVVAQACREFVTPR